MAISPPSDLVLDVVRAADPANVREAHRKLLAKSSEAAAPAFEPLADRPIGARVQADAGNVPQAHREFEAMVLQSFIKSMLPTDAENLYGSGTAGDIWKGMMAEQLGKALAAAGGIGIAEQLSDQRQPAQANEDHARSTGDNRNYANGLVQQIQRDILGNAGEQTGPFHEKT
ncbi:rod-binding protein [Hoeflea poritis]|uniref:Rod-binding protein n=1 Tax=Hoeflea poritis TaxID=2993659 RepID=A0ABT4VS74_9HYPH|nr:rod-binding protein [Hoeflea poritis]MDA4847563.1 rod-binding protein [Hoeflea poritis]